LGVEKGELTFFSTLTREGKDEIWQKIENLLFPESGSGSMRKGQQ
jgi:hypothetical protein